MIRRTLGVAVLAALVLFGVTLFEQQSSQQPTPVTTPEGSDYYMLDATVTQYNKQGEVRYRLNSDKSLHYPNDSIRLTDITVHYRGGKYGDWLLTAAHGYVPPSSQDILLTGDVTLVHAPESPHPVTIKTKRIWVRTKAGVAETNAVVRAHSLEMQVRGRGLTVEFDEKTLTLHHDVHVTITP